MTHFQVPSGDADGPTNLKTAPMPEAQAVKGLLALGNEHRIRVFRMLVKAGPEGVSAGDIARANGINPSTLTFHLNQLEQAGLVHSRRDKRRIIYAIDVTTMRSLLTFLTEDCCNGHPEICRLGELSALCG